MATTATRRWLPAPRALARTWAAPLALAAALPLGACGHIGARGVSLGTPGSACLHARRSLVYPLGDTTAGQPERAGAWLVLRPEPAAAGSAWRDALTVDVFGNEQRGVWRRAGDTLHVQTHDVFTTNTLALTAAGAGFRGVGSGTTDQMISTPGPHHRWLAELVEVRCRSVPRVPFAEAAAASAPRVAIAAYLRPDSLSRAAADSASTLLASLSGLAVTPSSEVRQYVGDYVYPSADGSMTAADLRVLATVFRARVLYDVAASADSAGVRVSATALEPLGPAGRRADRDSVVVVAIARGRDLTEAVRALVPQLAGDARRRSAGSP